MESIDELIKLKKKITKEIGPDALYLDLEKYPKVTMIITHRDNKSWGYFYETSIENNVERSEIQLCRNNEEAVFGAFFHKRTGKYTYSIKNVNNIIINHPSAEVVRVYTEYIQCVRKIHSQVWQDSNEFYGLFYVNPLLFTNLTDIIRTEYLESSNRSVSIDDKVFLSPSCLIWYDNNIHYWEPSTKKAFQASFGYVKNWLLLPHSNLQSILTLRSFYSPEEIFNHESTFFGYPCLPQNYWNNRECIKFFEELDLTNKCMYKDYLNLRGRFPADIRKQYPLFPKPTEIGALHNTMIRDFCRLREEIENSKQQERQDNYLKNYYNLAKEFEFSNKDFSIIACKNLSDLISEGRELHHCVGTYIESVSTGKEYILFLRRNSDINTPYFTIDVTPDNKVRQIHGLCNCNINDEIRSFVNTWANKFNLSLTGCSGVKCALY